MALDFRHILKDKTQLDHTRVDTALSGFDVATQAGLTGFLDIHHACFSQMRIASDNDAELQAGLTDMIDRIDADLRRLGARPSCATIGLDAAVDPLAMAYLVEGSRLGSKVLGRRWASSDDPNVLAADAYFSLEPVKGRWREVCDLLAAVPPDSTRAATISRDTATLFRLFLQTAQGAASDHATPKVLAS
ncbi:hypothetical protein [Pseudooctadecabacter sp.]|uniref:hypothetical protein n=1 Tax=Pseudooctadecabacter sp. TaxID=1966338 RepID=UPI0035C87BDD